MDINLDDLMKAKQGAVTKETPKLETSDEIIASVNQATNALTPAERASVDKIKDSIDLTDTAKVMSFGAPAQKQIAEFSDSVLSQVRTKDSGMVGELLGNLVDQVHTFEKEGDGGFVSKLPIIGNFVNKAENIKRSYDKLSVQVDRVQSALEQAKLKMMKDVVLMDHLYEENLGYFKNLQLYIRAGEEKLQELRTETLPKLHAQAAASNDPMAAQVVSDFEGSVDRFEKKIHDLKISKTIAIQTAPQIRLIQNNDKALIDRVQTAIYSTIPLWKNQMVIALGLASQQKVLKMQRAVNDTTNELLKRNAQMLKQNSVETAKENERSIVDIETVRQVNDDLISTITETLKIQQEGRAKRQAAEQQLVQIEDKLREAILKGSGRVPGAEGK